MKFMIKAFVLAGLLAPLSPVCKAASIVIDSFDEGAFSLAEDGTRTNISSIAGTIVDTRRVEGLGLGDWSAVLTLGSGFIEYDVQEIIPAGRPFGLFLSYTRNASSFSLLGFDAFLLDFSAVSGNGMLEIYLDSSETNSVVKVPITSAGVLEYSFDNLAAGSLENIDRMTISISPDSSPFSFRLNEVSVVPEPSALILTLFGVAGVFRRRRG
jgi:hypothetical protein